MLKNLANCVNNLADQIKKSSLNDTTRSKRFCGLSDVQAVALLCALPLISIVIYNTDFGSEEKKETVQEHQPAPAPHIAQQQQSASPQVAAPPKDMTEETALRAATVSEQPRQEVAAATVPEQPRQEVAAAMDTAPAVTAVETSQQEQRKVIPSGLQPVGSAEVCLQTIYPAEAVVVEDMEIATSKPQSKYKAPDGVYTAEARVYSCAETMIFNGAEERYVPAAEWAANATSEFVKSSLPCYHSGKSPLPLDQVEIDAN